MSDYDISFHKQVIERVNNIGKMYPCPFCRGEDLDYCDGGKGKFEYIAVYCRKCSACGPYGVDKKQAEYLWGRRLP